MAEAPQEKPVEPVQLDDKLLTEQEKKAVEEFSKKIDIKDTNLVLQYGAAAQKSVAGFLRERPEQMCAARIWRGGR